jgi:phenylalanyl-tRNA synthetase alpha chain
MVPPALARLAAEPVADVLVVCPGITYRRDVIDRLHTGTPHQLDLWRVTQGTVGEPQLYEMLQILAAALFPGRRWRSEPRRHPYTLGGLQVDVARDDEWIEVWECGLAHPDVLADAGLDGWTGLALGMGLDRLLMLRKGIPDIRLLRSGEPRVAGQMNSASSVCPSILRSRARPRWLPSSIRTSTRAEPFPRTVPSSSPTPRSRGCSSWG